MAKPHLKTRDKRVSTDDPYIHFQINVFMQYKNYIPKMRLFGHTFENREQIILRDYLALERTRLANERTLLSYIRTSLYMLLGGIAFLQMTEFREIQWLGYVSLGISGVSLVVGISRYLVINVRLKRYYEEARDKG